MHLLGVCDVTVELLAQHLLFVLDPDGEDEQSRCDDEEAPVRVERQRVPNIMMRVAAYIG